MKIMQNRIVFSIVIPVYNTVKELERCVSSITSSKFEHYEVVLVDDGSTDGSSELCDRLAEKCEKIKVVHKKNGGCSDARNRGIKEAQGEYLIFVDSDDLWTDDNALCEINELLQKEGKAEVVLFGVSIYTSDDKLVKQRVPEYVSGSKKQVLEQLVKKNQYISTSYVKVLDREFFIKNDLFFVKNLLSEDIEWSARIMMCCDSILIYPNAFYKRVYRDEGSITANIGKKNISDILDQIERGIRLIETTVEDAQMRDIYYEYWAYQYAVLMGHFRKIAQDEEYEKLFKRLEQYKWLLKYDNVKKVKLVHNLTKVGGLRFAVRVLEQYMKMRK